MSFLELAVIGLIAAIVIMTITYFLCLAIDNAGWVDVVWAFSIGGLSLFYFIIDGSNGYSWLPLAIILAWSIRLGSHLFVRIATEPEDGRYKAIEQKWGGRKSPMFFGFFMIQAAAAFVFSLPVLLAMRNASSVIGLIEILAIVVAMASIIGESIADHQLKSFKKFPNNHSEVCKEGLWRYSRHPNYFFEWTYWISYAVILAGTDAFYLSLLFPAIMLFLVLKVTGIPPTEAQAIRKRGDLYRQYQNETSAFFPWFPNTNNK